MKALLMKDFYTLWRQLRVYLLVMLVISVFNGSFGNIFITIWAALLPYTAMAYDERSKWDQMAAMMPYSTRDIVISKYVLGWLCTAAAALFAVIHTLILLNSLRQLHTVNAIALLRSENVGERPPRAKWVLTLAGVVLLGSVLLVALPLVVVAVAFLILWPRRNR